VIQAFVTNLGKYVESKLRGEWLTLPTTTEDVQALLSRIGVDGVIYEEIFITSCESDIDGLFRYFDEYESLDELNYLAVLLGEMPQHDLEKFKAAVANGAKAGSVKDLINLTQTLNWYVYFYGVHDTEELGRYLAEERGMEIPANIEPYFDYEAYGRDEEINYGGTFASTGFIARVPGSAPEQYRDRGDLPDEHKVLAYPEPEKSIQKTIAVYNQMISTTPATTAPGRSQPTQEDR